MDTKLANLIKTTEAEVEICKMAREASLRNIERLMENTSSEHFTHHLLSAAEGLARNDAKLRQTERVLEAMRQAEAK